MQSDLEKCYLVVRHHNEQFAINRSMASDREETVSLTWYKAPVMNSVHQLHLMDSTPLIVL